MTKNQELAQADEFEYRISELVFSDNSTVALSANDIVVLVGPNNAGKSAALRDIVTILDRQPGSGIQTDVIKSVDCAISTTDTALTQFLDSLETHPNRGDHVVRMGKSSNRIHLLQQVPNKVELRRALRAFCVYLVTTENRLQITNPVALVDLVVEPKGHPFHYLYDDAHLERDLSSVFRMAFGTDLIINRAQGSTVGLHIGARPGYAGMYESSPEYRRFVMNLPQLSQQGDGMRAFVGCLMWATVANYNMVMIDEPEAFLHPPQARLLGKTLATKKRNGTQLFLATHSGDLVRGLLDSGASNLRILRIVRDGNRNVVKELGGAEISSLWADPLLRQSNLLDGLFHSQVVLCEGDADCQFYSAVGNALVDATGGKSSLDTMFVHCGGKDRMPKVIRPLVAVGVPVLAVVDFDALRSEQPLRSLYEALGGNWNSIESDWREVSSNISSLKAQLDINDVKRDIAAALSKVKTTSVPDAVLDEIRTVVRKASAWSIAKTTGRSLLSPGEPVRAFDRLDAAARKKGLWIVQLGEVECFCRSIEFHGPQWVIEVCKRNLLNDSELQDARTFVRGLLSIDNGVINAEPTDRTY